MSSSVTYHRGTRQKMGTYVSHTHRDTRMYSRCWEYFVSPKVVPPHVGEEDKSQPSCEDTFTGICKPIAFTLFPYGDIHTCLFGMSLVDSGEGQEYAETITLSATLQNVHSLVWGGNLIKGPPHTSWKKTYS